MSRNGSGTMNPVTNSWNPQITGVLATGPDFLALYTDLINALTQSISADGQTPITGNLQMGGNKLTGLAAGSGTGQSLRWEQLFSQGVETAVASAATTDIGVINSNFINITGTTNITSFGTNYNGPRFLRFSDALTLTNSSTLVLPGGADITTAVGDTAVAYPIGNPATGWVVAYYTGGLLRFKEGAAIASAATVDLTVATGNTVHITGTTGISAWTMTTGQIVNVIFDDALLLTYSATTNNLPGTTDITTAANDRATLFYDGTTVYFLSYVKADGKPVVDTSTIQPINASVTSNAMTLTLNPTSLDFRSSALGSGVVNTRTITSAISTVISSGSTAGTTNAVANRIILLAIDNAGTVELAWVNQAGSLNLDETTLISTTAEGGTGGADSASTIYSTTARTNVPFRIVGYVESTQATAGTWATAPSKIQGSGGQASTSVVLNSFGVAPMFAPRAWVNFNGTGTVAIRASGNVSSITDNGTGDYTINFLIALPDANYCPIFGIQSAAVGSTTRQINIAASSDTSSPTTQTTTALRILSGASNTANLIDNASICVSILR